MLFKILWANALSMWQIKASRHLILGMERSQGAVSRNNILQRVGSKQWGQLVCQSHELAFSGVNASLAASLLTPRLLCRWENTFLCAYQFVLPCHANISAGAWGCRWGMKPSSDSLITPAANALSGLGAKYSVLYDVRSQKYFCIWFSWNLDIKGLECKCLWGLLLNESWSPVLGLWSWTPVLRFSAFLGMDDVHFLIPLWRNSLCCVQTGFRQIHVTLWSPLKEQARATTFNLLLLQYKLGYLHPHSFSKDNPHRMRPTSLCNGISFIASTLVNNTGAFGGPAHVSPCCKKLTQSGNCTPVNHVKNYPSFLGMKVKRQGLWQNFWKDTRAFCTLQCVSFCISAETL